MNQLNDKEIISVMGGAAEGKNTETAFKFPHLEPQQVGIYTGVALLGLSALKTGGNSMTGKGISLPIIVGTLAGTFSYLYQNAPELPSTNVSVDATTTSA